MVVTKWQHVQIQEVVLLVNVTKDGKVMADTAPMIINAIMVKLGVISMLRFVSSIFYREL